MIAWLLVCNQLAVLCCFKHYIYIYISEHEILPLMVCLWAYSYQIAHSSISKNNVTNTNWQYTLV